MKTNLYVEIQEKKCLSVIMPDENGEMQIPEPEGDDWYAVQWPTNPHFTGDWRIMEMINKSIIRDAITPPLQEAMK